MLYMFKTFVSLLSGHALYHVLSVANIFSKSYYGHKSHILST